MKRKGILFAAVLGLFALNSCVKDWDCECTLGSGNTTLVTHETIKESSLKKANDECEKKDADTFGSCKVKS